MSENPPFAPGQRVLCLDDRADAWMPGYVLSLPPGRVEVQLDGGGAPGFWPADQVRPLARPEGPAAAEAPCARCGQPGKPRPGLTQSYCDDCYQAGADRLLAALSAHRKADPDPGEGTGSPQRLEALRHEAALEAARLEALCKRLGDEEALLRGQADSLHREYLRVQPRLAGLRAYLQPEQGDESPF